MSSLTFEEIIKRKIGKAKESGTKIPAQLETALIQKGLGLNGMFSVRLSEETSAENLESAAVEAASERIDDILEDMINDTTGNRKRIRKKGSLRISGTTRGITSKDGKILSSRSLAAILNSLLFQTVQENMELPRLVYRTGRFAHSVNVTRVQAQDRVEAQRKNRVSIFYSYMLYPYQVFEKDARRDPRTLIELSIKQTLKDLLSPKSFKANIFTVTGGY